VVDIGSSSASGLTPPEAKAIRLPAFAKPSPLKGLKRLRWLFTAHMRTGHLLNQFTHRLRWRYQIFRSGCLAFTLYLELSARYLPARQYFHSTAAAVHPCSAAIHRKSCRAVSEYRCSKTLSLRNKQAGLLHYSYLITRYYFCGSFAHPPPSSRGKPTGVIFFVSGGFNGCLSGKRHPKNTA